ncbi:MAG: hypothetical protein AAGJ93_01535 [Bacteroidota bacterium]
MLNEQALRNLKDKLDVYLALLSQAADTIKTQDISNYPVFMVYEAEEYPGIGLPVVAAQEGEGAFGWSINASTLEEMVAKKIVAMENVDRFRSVYKTHPNAICCLVWHEDAGQFVFLPKEK